MRFDKFISVTTGLSRAVAKKEIKKVCNRTIPKNPKKLISYIPRFAGPINFPVIITPKDNIIKILITTIDNIYNE